MGMAHTVWHSAGHTHTHVHARTHRYDILPTQFLGKAQEVVDMIIFITMQLGERNNLVEEAGLLKNSSWCHKAGT